MKDHLQHIEETQKDRRESENKITKTASSVWIGVSTAGKVANVRSKTAPVPSKMRRNICICRLNKQTKNTRDKLPSIEQAKSHTQLRLGCGLPLGISRLSEERRQSVAGLFPLPPWYCPSPRPVHHNLACHLGLQSQQGISTTVRNTLLKVARGEEEQEAWVKKVWRDELNTNW